jgi:large subunit ribosomal protein L2
MSLKKYRLRKHGGRGQGGQVTSRHRGGGEKRLLRDIDWRRDKRDLPGRVASIEYDPNRTAKIALVVYADGDKRYILAPEGLAVGTKIMAGPTAEVKPGNALPLEKIPVGTPIHNLELTPGKGGQLVRAAGQAAAIQSKEGRLVTVLLPSKEQRLIDGRAYATVGSVGNAALRTVNRRKAGWTRHKGRRPQVRGVAMHPAAHPHGGGEGRSGVGMKSPKTPWGKRTMGKRTRARKKYSDKYTLVRRRR